jgi:hypothetical protein
MLLANERFQRGDRLILFLTGLLLKVEGTQASCKTKPSV